MLRLIDRNHKNRSAMKITVKSLGVISEAEFTVGDLTVICGKNNTGKTYITYSVYGFLDNWNNIDYWHDTNYWNSLNSSVFKNKLVSSIILNKELIFNLEEIFDEIKYLLHDIQLFFRFDLSKIFNSSQLANKEINFQIAVSFENFIKCSFYSNARFIDGDNSGIFINFEFNEKDKKFKIDLEFSEEAKEEDIIAFVTDAIKEKFFEFLVPKVFIASAERTGAALFQREIDFTRNRVVDLIKEININPQRVLGRFTAEYPLPVKHNIDFIRDLPNIINKQSELSKEHPEILVAFNEIVGGVYEVNSVGGINYSPVNNPELKLSLAESSSTIRSLVDIGFYLKHLAKKGELLMIDEPELNLHPENQRKIARLFALLVNCGLRVFITTHSDYIIKEFNTLLLLNQQDDRIQALAKREGYQDNQFLTPEQLEIYMTTPDTSVQDKQAYTLVAATVSADKGIELTSFDEVIEDMNRIQDEIVWD